MEREPIGKKLRFEVFKRDSFTCQYCGRKAPEAVLHCDHIKPVADGGRNELLNLITACEACNLGKGARPLSDDAVVTKQHAQLQELQERREQLEMLLEWRDSLEREKIDVVQQIATRIGERAHWEPNEAGCEDIRKWVRKYGVAHVLEAVDAAFDGYLEYRGNQPTQRSWNKAFAKIGAIASLKQQAETKPYMPKLAYIQGILRRTCRNKHMKCVEALEEIHLGYGVPLEDMERLAKAASTWEQYDQDCWDQFGEKDHTE